MGVAREPADSSLRCVSLFSGIGGLDRGLELSGFVIEQQCESWEPARAVLKAHWPTRDINHDVRTFEPEGPYKLLAAGFPCTDISHAGGKAGIDGPATSLVHHVFRIARQSQPTWILLENVPNLLRLHNGRGIRTIVDALESLGYQWAYRTVDSRFTGVPQRRSRILILASATEDPASVLLADDAGHQSMTADAPRSWGFYWTEGRFGVGVVPDAVPTLKGGSTLGLPSAPAVWIPEAEPGEKFKVIGVSDGEALQGLPRGWSDAAIGANRIDHRWKLICNAVTVGVAEWIGRCIFRYSHQDRRGHTHRTSSEFSKSGPWPPAAAGRGGRAWSYEVSAWPQRQAPQSLLSAVDPSAAKLSHRAVTGFLNRLDRSGLKLPDPMYLDLEEHQRLTRPQPRRLDTAGRRSHTNLASPVAYLLLQAEFARYGVDCEYQQRPVPDRRLRVDALIRTAQVAVQLRDCFWDSCEAHSDESSSMNTRWRTKLEATAKRNALLAHELDVAGWELVTIWTHDDLAKAVGRIVARLAPRGADGDQQTCLPLDPADHDRRDLDRPSDLSYPHAMMRP